VRDSEMGNYVILVLEQGVMEFVVLKMDITQFMVQDTPETIVEMPPTLSHETIVEMPPTLSQ